MSADLGQAAFRLGFFILFISGILLWFEPSGSAEQAITMVTFLIALIFLVVIAILVRLGQRKP